MGQRDGTHVLTTRVPEEEQHDLAAVLRQRNAAPETARGGELTANTVVDRIGLGTSMASVSEGTVFYSLMLKVTDITGLTDTQLRAAPVPVTISGAAAAVVRTPTILSTTTTGTVAAGATSVGFSNEGTVAATVAGGALPAGRTVSFIAPDGDTLAAIAYTATGTTLVVASVR